MESLGCRYLGPSPNFLALPGLQGEAAGAAVGKSRSGKKLAAVAKRFGFPFTLNCQGQFHESQAFSGSNK